MTTELWAKMPCSWQVESVMHRAIRGQNPLDFFGRKRFNCGEAIAALKLYIVLCLKANFTKLSHLPDTGCVQKSITDLEALADLSRPMVIKGMKRLEELGIVDVRPGRPKIYHITEYETAKYWVKLPRTYLFEGRHEKQVKRLSLLSNRSPGTLAALQLYLYIAALQNKTTGKAKVKYNVITERLGITRNAVSSAISVLVGHELMSVRLGDDEELLPTSFPCNVYWLRGQVGDVKAST